MKRDIALKAANGDILAFLDDDAYPRSDWLKNALKNFSDPDVAAVGGPAITPLEDSDLQKVSGAIFASFLVSGKFVYRYIPRPRREVDDYPSCNLLVRKSVMLQLGGFKTNFWPGEDTILCLEITKKLGKKIIYDPEVLIYHHRREVFLPHLKQISSYAMHRGYFVKKFPETSFKLPYFIPSLFLVFVLSGTALNCFPHLLKTLYLACVFLYLLLVFISSISRGLKPLLISEVFVGIILSHLAYGFYFIKGLISSKLKEEA